MHVSAFFNPARRAPVLCLLCLIFFGFIRPVRALQRAEEAEAIPLTYASLRGVWREHSETMRWLVNEPGRVEKRVPKDHKKGAMEFTGEPHGDGGFVVLLSPNPYISTKSGIRGSYRITGDRLRIGANTPYQVYITAERLTLITRTEAMEFIRVFTREE